jgi:predicted 3-demethylubiquinone-9 3-methyltransferase (glyoxalase superfamily)
VTRRIATHLMFQGQAEAAMQFYAATFKEFRIERVERYTGGEPSAEGMVKVAEVSFQGHALLVIDSPVKHQFTFTPAISLIVDCESADELDAAFARLSEGGQVFMPLDNYGFSQRFGWCSDRFGVSWQLNLP